MHHIRRMVAQRGGKVLALFFLGVFSLVVSLGSPAASTTLIRMGTKDLAKKASAIFYGVVDAVDEGWDERKTKIYTTAKFTVREVLKGDLDGEVIVKALGGRADGIAMMVPASPRFKKGQEAVMFLWQNSEGDYFVLGMVQGKKNVVSDPASSAKYLHSGSVVDDDGHAMEGKSVASEGMVPLSSYLDEIRLHLNE